MGDRTPYVIPQTVNATDGDVLTFSAATGTWVGAAGSGGGTATGLTFAADNATPTISQTQAASGAGAPMIVRSQEAFVGSGLQGGEFDVVLGKCDFNPIAENSQYYRVCVEKNAGGMPGTADVYQLQASVLLAGGVCGFGLAGGTDGIGGGLAGTEMTSFVEWSIASEFGTPIHIDSVHNTDFSRMYVQVTDHDTTNEAAFEFTYYVDHATSGDISGIQINAIEIAIGTGVQRYIDIFDGGSREFDIRPGPAGGASLNASTYIVLVAPTELAAGTPLFSVSNSGVFGWTWDQSTGNVKQTAQTSVSSALISIDDGSVATGAKLTLKGQNTSGATGGDTEIGPGTGGTSPGELSIINAKTITTVGAAGGASALPIAPTGYLFVKVPGDGLVEIPYYARA